MIQVLHQIIKRKNIKVIYFDLHHKNPLLEAYTLPRKQQIILDNSLPCRPRQYKCVLAEEVGHVLYPPLSSTTQYHIAEYWNLDFYQRSNISYWYSKNERTALQWATAFLIPDRDFWNYASQGPHEWWEWLERFDIEDWFMHRKVGFMRSKKHFKWREIVKRATIAGGFDV